MTTLMTPRPPARIINFAKIQPLFASTEATLVSSRPPAEGILLAPRFQNTDFGLLLERRAKTEAKLEQLETKTLTVPRVTGTVSPIAGTSALEAAGVANLDIPFGMPRFITIATMRKMLKAKDSDLVLKRNGRSWEVCDDAMKIDLSDDSVEFRVGDVQVYS